MGVYVCFARSVLRHVCLLLKKGGTGTTNWSLGRLWDIKTKLPNRSESSWILIFPMSTNDFHTTAIYINGRSLQSSSTTVLQLCCRRTLYIKWNFPWKFLHIFLSNTASRGSIYINVTFRGHPTVPFREYLFRRHKSPEIFGLIVVKTRNFFGERNINSDFRNKRSLVINSYCFRMDKYVVLAFSENHQQLGNWADRILFPKISAA